MKKRALVKKKYSDLNPSAAALATGIFSMAFIILAMFAVKLSALPSSIGLEELTFSKIIITILYSFIDGVIIGAVFAWLYNRLNRRL